MSPTNAERAGWARTAIGAFAFETNMRGEDLDTKIGDLLCNLIHLCDEEDLNFDDLVANAHDHHWHETREGQGAKA